MTEAEWLTCTDPIPMILHLRGVAADRKLRLFSCACCRDISHLFRGEIGRKTVSLGERHADHPAGREELRAARSKVSRAYSSVSRNLQRAYESSRDEGEESFMLARVIEATRAAIGKDAFSAAYDACICAAHAVGTAAARSGAPASYDDPDIYVTHELEGRRAQYQRQFGLLKDIFGNPFRPAVFDPIWRSPDVVALARGIYDDRAFDQLPILADALEESGCHDADILDHCRGPGTHALGCWVIDLIQGKP